MALDSLFWLAVTVLLVVLEASTATLVCIWFALGAAAALLISLLADGWLVQALVFVLVSALALVSTRPLVHRLRAQRTAPTNADRNIGRTATVLQPIAPGKPGRVRLDGVDWTARAHGEVTLAAGQPCRVYDIQSTVLIVEPQPEYAVL